MYRVALTGNIASGKSAVTDEWTRLGAYVIDADILARRAVEPGSAGLRRIAEQFGNAVIVDGALDRAALGRIVFRDAERRRALEAIVHPEVERLRAEEEELAMEQGAEVVVHAIPLLFETGLESGFDKVVVVDAPEDVRLERLVRHRGLSEADARAMIEAQQPSAGKRARADYVIDNDRTLAELKERAEEVWNRIVAAA
jgi:dephospho-CoA kinase